MQTSTSEPAATRWGRSVFFRTSLLVAISIAAVTLALEIASITAVMRFANDTVRQRGIEVTRLVSDQAGGAIRFGKVEALDKLMSETLAGSEGAALWASAVNAEGTPIASVGTAPKSEQDIGLLAEQAILTGTITPGADGFIVAAPARFGDGTVVGAIVIGWSAAPIRAGLRGDQFMSVAIGAIIFAVVLLCAGTILRRYLSRPLVALQTAIGQIAAKRFETEVPGTARQDEIGRIANTVASFRDALADAETSARDSLYKGAAFEGASVAMMMTDENLNILYVNAACRALMDRFSIHFQALDQGFDAAALVGTNLSGFVDPDALSVERMRQANANTVTADMRVGQERLNLTLNAAFDAHGNAIGIVAEWQDVTQERVNSAALATIDTDQVHGEFDTEGRLTSANPRLRAALGIESSELPDLRVTELLQGATPSGAPESIDWEAFTAAGALSRTFMAKAGQNAHAIIDGTLAIARDTAANPLRTILIGRDVTESRAAFLEAEQRRQELTDLQAVVVTALSEGLDGLADGDLVVSIQDDLGPEHEELRRNFNDAIARLRDAMATVILSVGHITDESNSISAGAGDLSERTERQAATLEETAAALDELTASVRSAAESADRASQMAAKARDTAQASEGIAQQTVSAMDEISTSAQEISKIVDVIDDIAFQTNLLALNAGVEAARAGESGRGFAVVASEVRALAQRSSGAAQEINSLISRSGTQVEHGVGLVDRMGEALRGIVASISGISSDIDGIAASVREQSGSLEEVNTAMSELDRVTQQNAAMFEETSAASMALTTEATKLNEMTARFRIRDDEENSGRLLTQKVANRNPVVADTAVNSPVVETAFERNSPKVKSTDESAEPEIPAVESDWDRAASF